MTLTFDKISVFDVLASWRSQAQNTCHLRNSLIAIFVYVCIIDIMLNIIISCVL